jgi:hypothetical protein
MQVFSAIGGNFSHVDMTLNIEITQDSEPASQLFGLYSSYRAFGVSLARLASFALPDIHVLIKWRRRNSEINPSIN